jgi:hypothetical protein
LHVYEVRPRKDHCGFDLISDVLPFGHLWCGEPNAISNAISYAQFYSRSHHAVIRVYDAAGNSESLIATPETPPTGRQELHSAISVERSDK